MNKLVIASTIGLLCGLLMALSGQAIIEATKSGSYNTVFGLSVITGLMATIGVVIAGLSLIGMVVGAIYFVTRK